MTRGTRRRPLAFDAGMAALAAFVAREGHTRVPHSHCEGPSNFPLGHWVSKRRSAYKRGALTADQKSWLEQVPGWEWFVRVVGAPLTFDEAARLLQDYAREHGHMRVPREHVVEGRQLGEWVQNQRALHRRGELCAEGVTILEGLAGWTWNPQQDGFAQGLESLRRYVQREGTARVPLDDEQDGFPLGRWVRKRRQLYSAGRRCPNQDRQLEALPGWTWDPFTDQFEKGILTLRAFMMREGHARPRASHVEDGFRLGAWVDKRRQEFRRGKLSPERIARLEALFGWAWSIAKKDAAAQRASRHGKDEDERLTHRSMVIAVTRRRARRMAVARVATFREDDDAPPWGGAGYARTFRPELVPPVDPARFVRIVLFCLPRAWPADSPDYWSEHAAGSFGHRLLQVVGQAETKWTPINHRFFAMLRLLEAGTRDVDRFRSHEEIRFHRAMLHTAAQLAVLADGSFDPVVFRRETLRVAAAMGSPLPPALQTRLLVAAGNALKARRTDAPAARPGRREEVLMDILRLLRVRRRRTIGKRR